MFGGYLYASSSDVVWRWAWDPATWRGGPIPGSPEAVIRNMDAIRAPGPGGDLSSPNGHVTRTLEFDLWGRLYVSVGSVGNVDNDSFRARIRRFTNLQNAQDLPVDFTTGEVFADGLRNEVGLAWSDPDKTVLYGVENGMDNLYRGDLGGDIHDDNPAEELNRFRIDEPGNHYGYPWCWSEYKLEHPDAGGKGTQWALQLARWDNPPDDAHCRNPAKNVPPVASFQAHSAPLGIVFYGTDWPDTDCMGTAVGLPCEYWGDAFIGFHVSVRRRQRRRAPRLTHVRRGPGTGQRPRATRSRACRSTAPRRRRWTRRRTQRTSCGRTRGRSGRRGSGRWTWRSAGQGSCSSRATRRARSSWSAAGRRSDWQSLPLNGGGGGEKNLGSPGTQPGLLCSLLCHLFGGNCAIRSFFSLVGPTM